jgi:hypothetical protein
MQATHTTAIESIAMKGADFRDEVHGSQPSATCGAAADEAI